ncbi:RidA family protein [Shewanella cyperi]|uniref:RidA family protein n=1 Tax=Shewanella cyperi TaxID=2814292 RepID=UPI001A9476A4|nr:RidA family protein [Shewanella cyperi]QSX40607.1 RidA family protein [Shewanella cyperi]
MTIRRLGVGQRMSNIVIHQGLVYLCGQVAKDKYQGITEQTRTMLEEVDALLLEAGSSREHLLSATLYLKDMGDYDAMNAVWDAWVPRGHAPARACVEAKIAEPEYLVEVSVIAALKP